MGKFESALWKIEKILVKYALSWFFAHPELQSSLIQFRDDIFDYVAASKEGYIAEKHVSYTARNLYKILKIWARDKDALQMEYLFDEDNYLASTLAFIALLTGTKVTIRCHDYIGFESKFPAIFFSGVQLTEQGKRLYERAYSECDNDYGYGYEFYSSDDDDEGFYSDDEDEESCSDDADRFEALTKLEVSDKVEAGQ
jgi:hypothetical protein